MKKKDGGNRKRTTKQKKKSPPPVVDDFDLPDVGGVKKSNNVTIASVIGLGVFLWGLWGSLTHSDALPVLIFGGLFEALGNMVTDWLVKLSGGRFYTEQLGAFLVILILIIGAVMYYVGRRSTIIVIDPEDD
jgi:hypothetical protein